MRILKKEFVAKNRVGRPSIEINEESFEKLCEMLCTLDEIAGFFNCSSDTIERWCKTHYEMEFRKIFSIKSASGKISIRRRQFEMAMEGNVTMLVWLGKQLLGQRDQVQSKIEIEHVKDQEKLKELPADDIAKEYFHMISQKAH